MKHQRSALIPIALGIIGILMAGSLQGAAAVTEDQLAFFEKHIRPALVKHCYECHSQESGKTKGGLLVDTREGLLQGGDSGPAVNVESPRDSLLLRALSHRDPDYSMPPKQKMPAEVIRQFETWFAMGAPDPRVREKFVVESYVDIEAGKAHWAFQKPKSRSKWGIDTYVAEKLYIAHMSPAAMADAPTLLRRLNFDLIGLPPTSEEAMAFVEAWEDDSEAAIESKVDELLGRVQFGERWGRHWLDVARYAESSGKDANFTFPQAWRYRDYVIDSFNADKPYDAFIREQIAGDLMPAKTKDERQELMIATGFLAIGTKGLNERNPRVFKMDLVDEQIDTMSQAILGMTVACARCHDHKFDPIPTTDYYALAGIFLSTDTLYGTVSGLQNRRPSELLILPNVDKRQQKRSYSPREIEDMRDRIGEIQRSMRSKRFEARRNGKQVKQREMLAGRNQVARIEGILGSLNSDGAPLTVAMGVQDLANAVNANVLVRGDVEKPAQEVERGFLQVLENSAVGKIGSGSSGRLELAEWLTSRENPLTARVMANRIWMHLLGNPLMGSPNNWGLRGQKPTHPELLDYLAIRFMENDWSMKSLIREIALSKTYRRSSSFDARNYEKDPDNKFLWRCNSRPMDAEVLRDSMLAISGKMNYERPLGSEIASVGDARFGRQVTKESIGRGNVHRSVYLAVPRNGLPAAMDLFDAADPNMSSAKRDTTIVPSQALYLMNNEFVVEQAAAMAQSLFRQFDDTDQRVQAAFLKAYGRVATPGEISATEEFFRDYTPTTIRSSSANDFRRPFGRRRGRGRFSQPSSQSIPMEQQSLAMFCQGLMASAEFRILD